MDMRDFIVVLDFLSRTIALILTIGSIVGFIFRKAVGTWIEDIRRKAYQSVFALYRPPRR